MNGEQAAPAVVKSAMADEPTLGARLQNVPDHELLGRIGSGSYGEVWLARNVLGRLRAVKIIYRGRFQDPRPFEREFEGIQRFEPISRSHPSQLAILHVGKQDDAGCFYYVMELGDDAAQSGNRGITETANNDSPPGLTYSHTDSVIRNSYVPHTLRYDVEQHGRLPISYCVQIGLSLATALGHLHQHGLVHRDIKPSNVIFVDGVPKLGDIGLVAEVGDTQSIVGTEGYIPPEGPGTPRADLYSLGKVLYEIGTGMDRRRFSELPEELHTWPDRVAVAELNEIVLKACARDPARRYSSAEALQADLAVLQRGQSVKRKRTIQRRLAIVTKLSLIGGLVVLMAVGGLLFRGAVNRSKRADSEDWLQLEMKGTKKWEAWNAYIMGLHYYQRETAEGTKRAIEYLKEAIRLDTNFARPYAAFAEICRWRDDLFPSDHEALRQGKEAASRAVVLDDSLAQGHKELGYFTADLDRDFARAEKEFQRSIKLSPNSSAGHGVYACCILLKLRRLQEAKQEARLALKLARTVPRLWCIAASISRAAGEQDEAVRQLRKALDVDRNYAWALEQLGEIHEEKGEFPEAIESFRKTAIAREVEPEQAAQRSRELSRAFANDKARGYWQKKLELADLRSSRGGVLYEVALIYLQLGETNSMFECLKRLEAQKSDSAFGINFDRRFDSVRSEPQFRALLQKLGLEK